MKGGRPLRPLPRPPGSPQAESGCPEGHRTPPFPLDISLKQKEEGRTMWMSVTFLRAWAVWSWVMIHALAPYVTAQDILRDDPLGKD